MDQITGTRTWQPNGLDRCDRCIQQASVRVVIPGTKSELLFCGHHFRTNEEKLRLIPSVQIDDHREPIPVQ